MISKRALKVDASGIRKVFELAAKIENPINLSIGQPDFEVPQEIKQAAIDSINQDFNKYTLTQGIPELREKVADRVNKSNNCSFTSDETIIVGGVSGGLLLALMSIVDEGDEIVFFDPYFVMYKHLVNLLGGKPVIVDTYPDFTIDYDKLKSVITDKTKAIIVNSPTNPTGNVYSKDDIDAVVKVAKEKNILLISDEIYNGFVYDKEFDSPSRYYDNTLILGGFSKTYAITGWRMGYALGNSEIIDQMKKLQQYTFVCAPSPFQYACVKAMDVDMSEYKDAYRKKRDFVYEGLKDNFNIVKPGGAFYIFPQLKSGDAGTFVEKAIQNKALIIPGNVFSERNTNFRISFAASDEDLKRGVDLLNGIIEK